MKQREPRKDQIRDKDSIRRYEIGADIDGDNTIPHIVDNTLSFHEESDKTFQKPKFLFVFRDFLDLYNFAYKIVDGVEAEYEKNKVKSKDLKK